MNPSQDFWEDIEVLTIETPEHLELKLPLSGFGPRFLAALVDSLIQGAVVFLLILVVALISAVVLPASPNPGTGSMMFFFVLIFVVLVLAVAGYGILFETIWNGQTPGKRITGIRVVKAGGLPLTFRDVVIRNLMRMVDNLPSYGFIGLISFFATKNQQRLGDLAAGTVVVREFTRQAPAYWPGAGGAAYPEPGGGTMTPRLSYAIGAYLSRCHILEMADRLAITGEVIKQLGYDPGPFNLQERENYLSSLLYSKAGAA